MVCLRDWTWRFGLIWFGLGVRCGFMNTSRLLGYLGVTHFMVALGTGRVAYYIRKRCV